MKTSQFIRVLTCEKAKEFSWFETDDKRTYLLGSFFSQYGNLLSRLSRQHDGDLDTVVLDEFSRQAEQSFELMLSEYKLQWFGQKWQMQERKNLDRKLFSRFQDYMTWFLKDARFIDANVKVHLVYPEDYQGEPVLLEDNAHLVIQKDGHFYGMVFHGGSPHKSMRGKSYATRLDYDLQYAVIKQHLEKKYPHIIITPVYFGTGEIKGVIENWCMDPSGTLKNNIFFLEYQECYDETGNFDEQICLSNALAGIHSMKKQTCDCCIYRQYCNMQTFSNRRVETVGKKTWNMPQFDDSQKDVISFKDGAMLCCAGPGSGKTATLIGRVLQLGKQVPTEQMLVITFADQAAGELQQRLEGLLPDDEMPRICTLNAFGMEIIRLHDRLNGTFHKLLTDSEKQGLIKGILEKMNEPLTGISYKQFSGSRFSTVSIVTRTLDEYMKNPEKVFEKNRELRREEWDALAESFLDIVSENHFISFDDQISLACEYMKQEQKLSDYIHSIYHYVMVDEYQDINEMQNELISLTAASGNIVCIGDDIQAIYSFRGGSSRFMKEFEQTYPGATIKWLANNYRSTKNIVRLCNEIRDGADDADYIKKEITESPNMIDGEVITLMGDNETASINKAVEDALKHGYQYKDIAIIATQHKFLKTLHSEMAYPTEMADAYLIYDFCFNVIFFTLGIVLKLAPIMENAYRSLGYLYEKPKEWYQAVPAIVQGKNLLPQDDAVARLLAFASSIVKEVTPTQYVARICAYLDMDETTSNEALCNLAYQTGVAKMDEFYYLLSDMVEFNADNKIEYAAADKIILTTAHGAKGKEYPVVILYDTDTYEGHVAKNVSDGSFDRNLLYVAASRAKRELHMFKKAGSASLLDNSCNIKKI